MKNIITFLLIGLLVWPYETKQGIDLRFYIYDHKRDGHRFFSPCHPDTLLLDNGSAYEMFKGGLVTGTCWEKSCKKDTTWFAKSWILEIKEPDKISML